MNDSLRQERVAVFTDDNKEVSQIVDNIIPVLGGKISNVVSMFHRQTLFVTAHILKLPENHAAVEQVPGQNPVTPEHQNAQLHKLNRSPKIRQRDRRHPANCN